MSWFAQNNTAFAKNIQKFHHWFLLCIVLHKCMCIYLLWYEIFLKLYFVFWWAIYPLTSWAVSLRDWLAVDMMDCRGSFLLVSETPPLPCDCLLYGWETDLEMEEKWLACILKLCTVLVLYGLQWNWDLKIYLHLVVMYRLQTKYYCIFTLLSY